MAVRAGGVLRTIGWVGLLATLGVARVEAQAAVDPVPPARTLEELRRQLDSIAAAHRVPGAGIALVTRDSVLWAGGVGVRDLATRAPVEATTHFRVGSISKTFVALGILRLVEQGRLGLDTPIRAVVPDVAIDNPWESTRPITVAMVLEHTAGFDDMRFNEMYVRPAAPDKPMAEVLAINPKSRRVRWEPGTRFSYSNPGYGIAGHLIEKVVGMPFERFIDDSVLAPLGMGSASFVLSDADTAAISQGYHGADPRPVGYTRIFLRPAGNLHASPEQLARAIRFFLNRGTLDSVRFLAPETIDRMERTETTLLARHGVQTGYGLGNYHTLNLAVPVSGHSGGIDGFSSELQYSSEAGVGWLVVVNGGDGGGLGEMIKAISRFMLRDFTPAPTPVVSVPSAELDRYVGYYRAASPRASLARIATDLIGGVRIVRRGDTLFQSRLFGSPEALVATGPATFRPRSGPVTDRAFILTDGGLVYASGAEYWERTSIWPLRLGLAALVIALVSIVLAVAHAFGWVPRRFLGRVPAGPATAVRLWPFLAVVALVGFLAAAVRYGLAAGATFNAASGTVFGLSVLAPVLALVALVKTVRANDRDAGFLARRFGILVSLACLGLVAWFGAYGFVGIRTWRY